MLFSRAFLVCLTVSLLFGLVSPRSEIADKCDTCRDIVNNFKEGLIKTAKSNFGGGNTQWEEKNLGSYAFSETRHLEITENVCSKDGKEERKCHHMLEANEEVLEDWWFKHYAKGVDTDLREYLCVKKMAVCCPKGTFGPDCKDCLGGRKKPCSGNGKCEGDGTRGGTGECVCDVGYRGALCIECTDGFYEETSDDTQTTCSACHPSCKLTCSEAGPEGCDECRDGWQLMDDRGCVDLDECEDVSMCGANQFCTNTDGSYTCAACSDACSRCTGPGIKDCTECSPKYFRAGAFCLPCHESCANSCSDETSKSCDSCNGGWIPSESGACEDVNECADGVGSCDTDEYCVNTVGSFKCSTCHPSCLKCTAPGIDGCTECRAGYQRNELNQCVDVNECSLPDTCSGKRRTCVNVPGSFRCECDKGYVQVGDTCELPPKEEPKTSQNLKSDQSRKSQNKNSKTKKPLPVMPPPKKKPKHGSQTMTVAREDSMLYVGSLVVFTIVCAVLRQSVVSQVLLTGTFWGFLYWFASQMEHYIIKPTS